MANKIYLNHTLEEYNKKYGDKNLKKVNKVDADKDKSLLGGHSWWLINDIYYEVPTNKGFKGWWSNLGKTGQIVTCCLAGATVVTAVVVPTVIAVTKNNSRNTSIIESFTNVKIKESKTVDGNLEITLECSETVKVITGIDKITISDNYVLSDLDYTFDMTTNKLTIKKSVLDAHKGNIIITPRVGFSFKVSLNSDDSKLEYDIQTNGSVKGKLTAKEFETKFVNSIKIIKGDYQLKDNEYSFDLTTGEFSISSEIIKAHNGDIVITTKLEIIKEDHIEVASMPKLVNPECFDVLDLTGLKINLVTNNGIKKDVTDECTTDHQSGEEYFMKVGEFEINVTHTKTQFTTKFYLNVVKATYVLDSSPNIDIDNPGCMYFKGYNGKGLVHVGPGCIDPFNTDILDWKIQYDNEVRYQLYTNPFSVGKGGPGVIGYKKGSEEHYEVKNIDVEIASFSRVKIEDNKVSSLSKGETSGNVTIPSKYYDSDAKKWITIDTIPDEAFKDCVNMTRVVIPSSITSIGKDAFKGCTNLVDVCIENDMIATTYTTKEQFQGLLDNVASVKILQSGDEKLKYPYFDQDEDTTGLFNTTSDTGVKESIKGEKPIIYHYYEKVTPELKTKLIYDNGSFKIDQEQKLEASVTDLYIPNYFHRVEDEKDVVGNIKMIDLVAFENIKDNIKSIYFPNMIDGNKIGYIYEHYCESFTGVEKVHFPGIKENYKLLSEAFSQCKANLFIYRNLNISSINNQFLKFEGYINLTDFLESDDIFNLSLNAFEQVEEEEEYKCKGIIVRNDAVKKKYLANKNYEEINNAGIKIYVEGEQPEIE